MTFDHFDIHCHLNDERFDGDRERVLLRMKEQNIGAIVVGTDREMSRKAVELASAHDNLRAAVGMHPEDNHAEDFDSQFYRKLLQNTKVVAIGECGLDYGRNPDEVSGEEKKRQSDIFVAHIELAKKTGKPLMIHCRNAYDDLLEILEMHGSNVRGNMHFFAGDLPTAQKFLAIGFSLSFDGPITFVRDYDEVIRNVPLDKIMAETDAPYVAPVPYRGKRNEPIYVVEIAKKIAEIRGESILVAQKAMVDNALRIFGVV